MGERVLSGGERRDLVRELAEKPGGVWVTCAGRSMEPTVRMGERVLVKAARGVRPGEVVLFETGARDAYVLHRVVFRVPGVPYFLHIGDAGSGEGPGVAHLSRLVGRAELPRRRVPVRTALAGALTVARAAARRVWRRRAR